MVLILVIGVFCRLLVVDEFSIGIVKFINEFYRVLDYKICINGYKNFYLGFRMWFFLFLSKNFFCNWVRICFL